MPEEVTGRPNHVVERRPNGTFARWAEKSRSGASSGRPSPHSGSGYTIRAVNPQELVIHENPSDAAPSFSLNKQNPTLMDATEQFQTMLKTAGAVTGGAVVARRIVSPVVDRVSNSIGLQGDVKRLARLGSLTAASIVAMSQKNEIINSIGVGHGVAVVEEAIDWAMTKVGTPSASGGGGDTDVQGGLSLLTDGLNSGYASEYGAAAAEPFGQMPEPSFAPGA